MSYEAFGDDDCDDDSHFRDHLRKYGWWDEDTTQRVQDAVRALRAETLYEGGEKANGISVRFLARLTILADETGVGEHCTPVLVEEARRILGLSGNS